MRLLVVANDLLVYAAAIAQPTGIQRVGFGIAAAIVGSDADPRISEGSAHRTSALLVAVDAQGARRIDPTSIGLSAKGARRNASASARLAAPLLDLLALAPRSAQERVRALARRLLAARAERTGVAIDVRSDDWLIVVGAPWIAPRMAAATIALKKECGARLAVLVHDLLPLTAPQWYADDQSGEARDDVAALASSADRLFAISPKVAEEVRSLLGREAVTLTPADPTFAADVAFGKERVAPFEGDLPYILCVGTLHPRKRIDALIRAVAAIAERNGVDAAPRLVVAGRRHPQDGAVFAALRACASIPGLAERIVFVHDADDARLATLYAGCRFVALPSLAEGWGIPVREALAAGRPVIATDAVPAAIGSPFVRVVPAGDDAALTDAIDAWWGGDAPERLAARIVAEFVPRNWRDVANDLRAALD